MRVNKITYQKLIQEAQRLIDQGFDEKVVREGFFDFMQGTGGSAVTQTIKTEVAKYILDKLKIVDTNSFLGLAILNLFANIEFKDYPKLTDCGFVSAELTKSILETFVDKMRISAGLDAILFKGIKEVVTEVGANTEAFKTLQKYVGQIICPIVAEIGDRFDFSSFEGK